MAAVEAAMFYSKIYKSVKILVQNFLIGWLLLLTNSIYVL